MGRVYEQITDHQREWIARQALFFVATAPLAADGHVNVSPKGPIGSLKVLDDHTVAYLDVVGSGSETIAHLRENGRIVVMFCAFDGPPRILRLHGRGEVIARDDPRFGDLRSRCDFEDLSLPEARRSIVVVGVDRIADSCGYGVPEMAFVGMREHHRRSAEKKLRTKGAEGLEREVLDPSIRSIDGLPALKTEE